MSQVELIRAISRATKESVSEIRRRGFQLLDAMLVEDDGDLLGTSPSYVDWDHVAAERVSIYP